MPILNLSKVKKDTTVEGANKDVPDELPSLPVEMPKIEKREEKPIEEKKPEPAPVSVVIPEKKLAPDELPPIKKQIIIESHTVDEPTNIVKTEEIKPKVLDERLYFSKLIKQINEGLPLEDIEKEFIAKDVIVSLNRNSEVNKKLDDKSQIENNIKSTISGLQKLEREWITLKKEIEMKQVKFNEIEQKIKQDSDNIKKEFSSIEELKKQF